MRLFPHHYDLDDKVAVCFIAFMGTIAVGSTAFFVINALRDFGHLPFCG